MENLFETCLQKLQKVTDKVLMHESIESLKADPFSRLANGMQSPIPNPLTDEQKQAIIAKLPAARATMEKEFDISRNDDLQLFAGTRFNNDDDVIWRIESISPERLAGRDPTSEDIIYDALYDCADSDYYYMFDKDWGTPDYDDGDSDEDYGDDDDDYAGTMETLND